jgi:hypothetical protein
VYSARLICTSACTQLDYKQYWEFGVVDIVVVDQRVRTQLDYNQYWAFIGLGGENNAADEGYRGPGYNQNFDHADEYPPSQEFVQAPPRKEIDLSKHIFHIFGLGCFVWFFLTSQFCFSILQMLWLTSKRGSNMIQMTSVTYTQCSLHEMVRMLGWRKEYWIQWLVMLSAIEGVCKGYGKRRRQEVRSMLSRASES